MSELSKLVTRLENGAALPVRLYAKTGRAHIVGITGPPGVGKSCLIDRLIDEYRRQNKTVGVVAVDPTSPITGGAFLGDRLRMQRHSDDDGVFIRSLATRNHRGGVTDSTPAIVHALDAAGFDVVIVETVGTGQDEVEVADVADTVVVVLMPELGDAIQRAKSGLMEIADILVVNKSDLGETRAEGIRASAKTGKGIPALAAAIEAHRAALAKSGELAKRRTRAARAEVIRLLQSQVSVSILRVLETERAQTILNSVAERKLDPLDAVKELSQELRNVTSKPRRHP